MDLNNTNSPMEEMPQATEPTAGVAANTTTAAKHSRKRLVLLGGLLVLGILISIPICQFMFGFFGSFPEEMKNTSQVIDEYLSAMAQKDAQRAYKVVYVNGNESIALADLEGLVNGNNYFVFKDYREHSFTGFEMTQVGSVKYAEISGDVTYETNFVGQFSAVLVKENGVWKIQGIHVFAPAEKFGK